ncbi:hypothetical protein B0H11DRAFT_2238118 [Mycena galericulata]|nr:hypothetical protein B0H11DRAFT_2238118 [Mycena galericulata]
MSSTIPGSLSKGDESIVRKLLKSIRATKYEDPVDQDAFLVECAHSLLKFRPQVASFAQVAELADCAFTLRSMMHANGVRLGSPPSAAFVSIQDFAGEIIRKRRIFRERQRANAERAKSAEGMIARLERNNALEHAAKTLPTSPDEDAISIPSSSDDGMAPQDLQPVAKDPSPSPIKVEPAPTPLSSQVRLATLLTPIDELGLHFGRLSIPAHRPCPPSSPLSSSPSLPDLAPDFFLGQHRLPTKGNDWKKERAGAGMIIRPSRPPFMHDRVVQCNALQMVPRPFGPPALQPRFIDDWQQSKPKSVDSWRSRKNSPGSSKHSASPSQMIHRSFRKTKQNNKRCYYCSAPDHLVALCPLLHFLVIINLQTAQLQVILAWLQSYSFKLYIQELLDVRSPDGPIELANNRSRFLPLNDPSSTVFLTSTISPGSKW